MAVHDGVQFCNQPNVSSTGAWVHTQQ